MTKQDLQRDFSPKAETLLYEGLKMKKYFAIALLVISMLSPSFVQGDSNDTSPKDNKTSKYTIKSGDTLYSIAMKNNTTIAKIRKENGLKQGEALRQGRILDIPLSSTETKEFQSRKLANTLRSVKFKKAEEYKSSKFSLSDIFFTPPSKKAEPSKYAIHVEYNCLRRESRLLDDNVSDASTIARAVEFKCRSYSKKYMYTVMPQKVKKNKYLKSKYITDFTKGRTKFIRDQALTFILENRTHNR